MRNALLAGLAGLMLAGPVLADERRDWRQDQRQDWREDRRQDWRDERRDDRRHYREGYQDGRRADDWRWNGARYRGPAYVYPRGYGYQAWGVGHRVPNVYFSNRYWIGNPGYYRLPPAFPGTRWVRIGADALLIDLRAGVVVRAVRGLYW
jgi:Ni/Co efflux regulator RcnB